MASDETPKKSPKPTPTPRPSGEEARRTAFVVGGAVVVLLAVIIVALATHRSGPSANPGASPESPMASPRVPICKNLSPPLLMMRTERERPYPMTIDPEKSYEAEVTTSCGTIRINLRADKAPIAVNNFVNLAKAKFFTGMIFHRIDSSLGIIQTGDPTCPTSIEQCGTGGPGYTIKDEWPNGLQARVGAVAMASGGVRDSSGSQFEIIVNEDGPKFPKERTIFGALIGEHSRQVAKVILSIPTKIQPGAPPEAPKDYSDGEFVYIEHIDIIEKGGKS